MRRILLGVTVPFTANAFLREQAELLHSYGWDVHLFTSNGPGIEQLKALAIWHVHTVEMNRGGLVPLDGKGLLQIIRLIRQVRPQVVVVGTPKSGFLGSIASFLCRTPVRIYHARGLRAEGLKGMARLLSLAAERLASSLATYVLVDSPSLLAAMRRTKCISRGKGTVLGRGSASGVNTEYMRPPNRKQREDARRDLDLDSLDLVVIFVGRLTHDKGVHDLVNAVGNLRNQGLRLKLYLVGPVEDDDILGEIESRGSWISWFGYQADIRPFLWASDVFSLPSYREGLPIAVLEASAVALPVVTTDVTGCKDAVVNGTTGLLVSPRDHEELSQKIMQLTTDAALRKRLGVEGSAWVSREFSSIDVNQRFARLIEDLLPQAT